MSEIPPTPQSPTTPTMTPSSSNSGLASIVTSQLQGDDEAVQATNDDAAICKRSAVHVGYWSDPCLQYFMRGPVVRKPPEINRGYFARTHCMYSLIIQTLDKIANSDVKYIPKAGPGEQNRSRSNSVCETEVQIVNLGCGYDTLYWRLKRDEDIRDKMNKIRISSFVDVDFPTTTMKKVHCIKNTKALLASLNNDGKFGVKKYNPFRYL